MASTMYYGGEKMSKLFEDGNHSLHESSDLIYKCLGDILEVDTCKDDKKPFVIADFGTADASVGLPLFNVMIGVDINHENTSLLQEQVTILVEASSMYKKCLPPNYVDFAMTSCAIHFLSSLPCHIKGCVTYLDADEEEYRKIKVRAEEDWKNFVINRGKELKPGGKLVIIAFTKDRNGKIIEEVVGGLYTLTKIAKQLLSEKYITQEELTSMTHPGFYDMSEDDFRKIFFQGDNEVRNLGLELDHLQCKRTTGIPGLSREESKNGAKKKLYAHRVAELHKLWLYSSIYHGLCTGRTEQERQKLADLYFEKLEEFAFNAPTHPPVVMPYDEIIISKRCSDM